MAFCQTACLLASPQFHTLFTTNAPESAQPNALKPTLVLPGQNLSDYCPELCQQVSFCQFDPAILNNIIARCLGGFACARCMPQIKE
jgi:hypothetical protein